MKRALIAALLVLLCGSWAFSQTPRIQLVSVGSGFSSPILYTHAPDGSSRPFIVEQSGRIRRGGASPTVFLDIRTRVVSGGERGLLGLAFHPQYVQNRRFFVNYTRAADGATVIAEYRTAGSDPENSVADPNSERIILTIPQPFDNHNGGMIAFGPDGSLYIGMGDGGSGNDPGNRAQDPNNLLGKMLRLDVETGRVEMFAMGLRNPWRFSFDRLRGDLWAGDVGQNAREEVDIIRQGGNYGWRILEGTRCTGLGPGSCTNPQFIPPVTEYVNNGVRCSITGGYVYRGSLATLPYGAYIFGDYCSGEIFMWSTGLQTVLLDTQVNISSFGEDASGELYVVAHGGTIYRITNPDVVTVSQRNFALPDRGSLSFIAGEGIPNLDVGYARVQASSGGLPAGLAMYGLRNAGVMVAETSVPISPLISSGRISAETGASVSTGIAIANANSQPVTISFYFTDESGQVVRQATAAIPAGEQIARFLHEEPFSGPAAFRGTWTFTASALVSAIALRGFNNQRSEFLFTNLPVSPLGGSPGAVHLPQYANGSGWTTEIILVNPSNAPISGTLQSAASLNLNGQNGSNFPYSIPAGASTRFVSGGDGTAVQVAAVRVTPSGPEPAPSAIALFRYESGGVTVTEAGVIGSPAGVAFRTYAELAGTVQSGLAIANPSPSAVNVTLELSSSAGGAPAFTATLLLPADSHTALYLRELPAFAAIPQPFRGVLRISAGSPVAVTALRNRVNERGELLITATPPFDESTSISSSELLFPHYVTGERYETEFILFNGRVGSSQVGTIYFIDAAGQARTLVLR